MFSNKNQRLCTNRQSSNSFYSNLLTNPRLTEITAFNRFRQGFSGGIRLIGRSSRPKTRFRLYSAKNHGQLHIQLNEVKKRRMLWRSFFVTSANLQIDTKNTWMIRKIATTTETWKLPFMSFRDEMLKPFFRGGKPIAAEINHHAPCTGTGMCRSNDFSPCRLCFYASNNRKVYRYLYKKDVNIPRRTQRTVRIMMSEVSMVRTPGNINQACGFQGRGFS